MEKRTVQSLIPPRSIYDLVIDSAAMVGSGRQGIVYPLAQSDSLVKIYADASAKRHTVPLVRYLVANSLTKASASLQGLPVDVFEVDDGRIGLLMKRAPGVSLGKDRYQRLCALGLRQRLPLAASLAEGVSALHRHGVVVADLAEAAW